MEKPQEVSKEMRDFIHELFIGKNKGIEQKMIKILQWVVKMREKKQPKESIDQMLTIFYSLDDLCNLNYQIEQLEKLEKAKEAGFLHIHKKVKARFEAEDDYITLQERAWKSKELIELQALARVGLKK